MLEKGSSPRRVVLKLITGNSSWSSRVEIKQPWKNEEAITSYKELVQVNYDATEQILKSNMSQDEVTVLSEEDIIIYLFIYLFIFNLIN